MLISKVAREPRFLRPALPFVSARRAFGAFLDAADLADDVAVLLPAFIGWSANEGSGVFDPVRERALPVRFYPMTDTLRIDVEGLAASLEQHPGAVLVLIHYFGYVDPAYDAALDLARRHGAIVLEDEAHAMLTDLVGGRSGRAGDASVFSLHKMLPVPTGGTLVFNVPTHPFLARVEPDDERQGHPWDYDLHAIAARRVENARIVAEEITALAGDVTPLWAALPEGIVPQTYPVVVEHVSRDALYFGMNAAGYGVVSLYHTMISELSAEAFPDAHRLARRILNLPVHQDAQPDQLRAMVGELGRQIRSLRADD